jgi:hypothetical protein
MVAYCSSCRADRGRHTLRGSNSSSHDFRRRYLSNTYLEKRPIFEERAQKHNSRGSDGHRGSMFNVFSALRQIDIPCFVRKTGPRSNKIKQMQKQKTQKTHNTRETQIYVVHPVWATSTREIARSFLYYYPANEGIQPTAKPAVTSSSFSHSLLSQNTIFTLIHSRNTFPS